MRKTAIFWRGYAFSNNTYTFRQMLNCFIRFLSTINSQIDFWHKLDSITMQDLDNADLQMDLGVFSSAWKYNNGGQISLINENKKPFFADNNGWVKPTKEGKYGR